MRLFVSVDLPDSLADPIADLQDRFGDAAGLNLVDPEQAHVTLKFLGETAEDRLPQLEDALDTAVEEAGVEPFEASVEGVGAFPSEEYIRVVWAGIGDGAAEMTRLHEAVENRTTALGFEPEDHEFTPHITVARMNDARSKERVQRVLRDDDPTLGSFQVREVRLTESTLGPDGPEYETVSRFAL